MLFVLQLGVNLGDTYETSFGKYRNSDFLQQYMLTYFWSSVLLHITLIHPFFEEPQSNIPMNSATYDNEFQMRDSAEEWASV